MDKIKDIIVGLLNKIGFFDWEIIHYVLLVFALVVISWCFGTITYTIMQRKGYAGEGFVFGFFLWIIALIVVLCKPAKKASAGEVKSVEEFYQDLLDNGGWQCKCGKIHDYHVGTCPCGISRKDCEA